jgi:hypothetical protein
MATVYLPAADELRRMLAMMYERLKVSEGEPVSEDGPKCVVAIYLSDDDAPIAAALADYPFAAFTGAALTMIPAGGAEDAVADKDLGGAILENVHEVFNICSRLLMDADSPHLRLSDVYEGIGAVPEEHKAVFAATDRVSFQVEVPNYGTGNVTFLGL